MLYRSFSEVSATPGRGIVKHMRQRSLDASRFCFAIPTEATATDAEMQSHREKVTKNSGIPANRGTPTVHTSGPQSPAPHKMGSRTQPETPVIPHLCLNPQHRLSTPRASFLIAASHGGHQGTWMGGKLVTGLKQDGGGRAA